MNAQRQKDGIIVDEMGIAFVRHGDFVLKCAYQPIYRRDQDRLQIMGVRGLTMPTRNGVQVRAEEVFQGEHEGDRRRVDSMCRALHLENHQNVGLESLELFFDFDPRGVGGTMATLNLIDVLARLPDEIELRPRSLVCVIKDARMQDREVLGSAAREMRARGISVAIDDFGADDLMLDRLDLIRPDIVRIDGAWFRRLLSRSETSRLIGSLVAALHARGAKVLVDGLETPTQIAAALDAGADFLQGAVLARPRPAGAALDADALSVSDLLNPVDNVVHLFR